jgi:hypothetical protein
LRTIAIDAAEARTEADEFRRRHAFAEFPRRYVASVVPGRASRSDASLGVGPMIDAPGPQLNLAKGGGFMPRAPPRRVLSRTPRQCRYALSRRVRTARISRRSFHSRWE